MEKTGKVFRAFLLVTLFISRFLANLRAKALMHTDKASIEMDIHAIFAFVVIVIAAIVVISIYFSLTTPVGQAGYGGIGLALANAIASPFISIGNGVGSVFSNLFGGLGSAISKAFGGL